jgi:hypothetical protein
MKTKILLFTVILAASQNSYSWNISTDTFSNWSSALQPAPGVYTELAQYFKDQDINETSAEVQKYLPAFTLQIHQDFLQKVNSILVDSENPNLKCSSQTEINFPNRITNFKIGADFESEALNVESMDCLGKLDINKVFTTLMSDEFQKKSVNGLDQIITDESTNQVCQKTSVFPIGKSDYCFTQNIWKDESTYVIQSFNELNRNNPTAPVYFREVFTIIKQLTSGEVFIYNVVMGRGPDLPFHSFVIKKVKSQQQDMIQQLIRDAR